MAKILRLNVYKKWFDMIESGEKTEDYREINEKWIKRLIKEDYQESYLNYKLKPEHRKYYNYNYIFKEFSKILLIDIETKRQKFFDFDYIEIEHGNLEWGAEPLKDYFVIKLGESIK